MDLARASPGRKNPAPCGTTGLAIGLGWLMARMLAGRAHQRSSMSPVITKVVLSSSRSFTVVSRVFHSV